MMSKQKNPTWEDIKNEAIKKLRTHGELSGEKGAFTPIVKMIIEAALEEELKEHIKTSPVKNRKNGKAPKTVKTAYGSVKIEPSRDRLGTYSPVFLQKRELTLGKSIDNKIIALVSRGMSYSDISALLKEIYGLDVSESLITNITEHMCELAKEHQNRPLEKVYVAIWMDAFYLKVRHEGRVVSRAVHCIIGVNQDGYKDVLGMYMAKSESASYWLQILNELKNRGVEDILIACIDNLKGFKEAIKTAFPKTRVQLCVVHQIRNSLQYIATKDKKEFIDDLKTIYKAGSLALADNALKELEDKWGKKYSHVVKSWKNNWPELSEYFEFSPEIRRIIYTTNMVESFHSQIRKITKTKRIFPSDESVMKLLYMVQQNIVKKWNRPIQNWGLILSELSIIFGDRLYLKLKM